MHHDQMGCAALRAAVAPSTPRGPSVLTISSGHSASYLTEAVATGRENYYTGAVTAGEPPAAGTATEPPSWGCPARWTHTT